MRGRVKRGVLVAIMKRAHAEQLLAEIAEKAPIAHLAYWLEPVLGFGRMAPAAEESEPVATDTSAARDSAAAQSDGKAQIAGDGKSEAPALKS